MPTLLQLSDVTILNLDAVTVILRVGSTWRVWLADPTEPLEMTDAEHAVLARYLRNHTERRSWYEARSGMPPVAEVP